jgi:glutaredoxin
MMSDTVVLIYGGPGCSYCIAAERVAKERGFSVVKEDINEVSPAEWLARIQIIPRSIPQIFVNGEYVGGYDSFVGWLNENNL